MAQLVVTSGSDSGTLYILGDEAVMGRHSAADIVVRDLAASRRHARIRKTEDGYVIEDLGSHNGTIVQGEPIRSRPLKDGYVIQIGECKFLFQDDLRDGSTTHASVGAGASVTRGGSYDTQQSFVENINAMEMLGVEEVSRASKPLALLYEMSHAVASYLQLDDLLPAMLGRLFEAFPQTDRGLIMVQGVDSEGLQVRCVKKRYPDDKDEVTISRGVYQKVLNQRMAALTHNLKPHPLSGNPGQSPREMCCVMAVPLLHHDQLLGLIYMETWDAERSYTREDLRLIASLVPEATIAIQNARVHEQALRMQIIKRDLEIATLVQEQFLPRDLPNLPGYTFVTHYNPPQEISGDFFDFIPTPDGGLVVLVADVCGKGISAGLMMAKLSSEARFCILTNQKLSDGLLALNASLSRSSMEPMFVTLIAAAINPRTGQLSMVNAGHPPAILKRSGGEVSELESGVGIPLGILPETAYKQQVLTLQPGDSLLLYTDGVFDATNARSEPYGQERLRRTTAISEPGPIGISRGLLDDLNTFIAGTPLRDDMTFVCFGRNPDAPPSSDADDEPKSATEEEITRDSQK
ncbi:MAG TPA: SpoIIE family protein phosphatase [Candidatus Brocadiia bacterium]|nr:SpoIIE family protein phosphatase [Candidatus Brocadiia bacterium]